LGVDLGIMFANASEIKIAGETVQDYSLDLSGLTLDINLLIPYKL